MLVKIDISSFAPFINEFFAEAIIEGYVKNPKLEVKYSDLSIQANNEAALKPPLKMLFDFSGLRFSSKILDFSESLKLFFHTLREEYNFPTELIFKLFNSIDYNCYIQTSIILKELDGRYIVPLIGCEHIDEDSYDIT